jgi:hypothetical protein
MSRNLPSDKAMGRRVKKRPGIQILRPVAVLALAICVIVTNQALSFTSSEQSADAAVRHSTISNKAVAPPSNCLGANAMIKEVCKAYIFSKPVVSPALAYKAKTEAYKNGCHIQLSTRPRFKSCYYGTTKGFKTTIALVGDSHATQWLPAFDVAGKASGVRIQTFLMSECLYGAVILPANCKGFAPWVLSSIKKSPQSFAAIFMSNRVSRPEIGTRAAFLKRSFTATLQSLKATNIKLFFIGDTPLGTLNHTDPNICLSSKAPKDCFGLTKDVKWNNPFADAVVQSGLAEYIPVDNLFCIGTKCYRSIGGLPVYRDDDHMNVYYSKSTIDIWKTRFDELLKRPGA